MEERELNIHVTEGVKELVIRHGDALPVKEPVSVKFTGLIETPGDYYQKRKGESVDMGLLGKLTPTLNKFCSVVEIDIEGKEITFIEDDRNAYSHVVVGKLEAFPEIAELGINTGRMMDEKTMLKLLLYKKRWFEDKIEYEKLIEGLKKFNFVMNGSGINENDHAGSKRQLRENQITSNINLKFKLHMPLFKNHKPNSFYVDIRLDVSDGGKVQFWFESIELHEMIETEAESILKKEAARFDDLPIV